MGGSALGSILWFLGLGLFFYWMMKRGGRGAHGHVHRDGQGQHARHGMDGGGGAGPEGRDSAQVVDPVCTMKIDPGKAIAVREVMGRRFYLCSEACLAKFDREPMKYAHATGGHDAKDAQPHRHHGC